MTKDITLLVGSCDDYSCLWDNFKTLEEKYIDLPESPKVVFTESLDFGKGYTMSHSQDPHWSNRLSEALDKVTTEYVFFVLEDYYFTKEITSTDFKEITKVMEEFKLDKFMFVTEITSYAVAPLSTPLTSLSMKGEYYLQHPSSMYLTSVQPAVWKTSYLKECVQKNWTPWEFEIDGSRLRAGKPQTNILFLTDTFYFNAVRKGLKISPGWEKVKEKENLLELVLPTLL